MGITATISRHPSVARDYSPAPLAGKCWDGGNSRGLGVLFIAALAGLEATDDLILIGVDVFANKDRLRGDLTCECRVQGLEVETAARKVEYVRERPTCQLQEPFGAVHVGRQRLQEAFEGIQVHQRVRLIGKGLDGILAMGVVGGRGAFCSDRQAGAALGMR